MARAFPASSYSTMQGRGGYTSYPGSASTAAQHRSVFSTATAATTQRPSLVTGAGAAGVTRLADGRVITQPHAMQASQPQRAAVPMPATQQPAAQSRPGMAAGMAQNRLLQSTPAAAPEAAPVFARAVQKRRATAPAGGDAADPELSHLLLLLRNPNLLAQCATRLFRRGDANGDGVVSADELLALIPMVHEEVGLSILEDSEDIQTLVRSRMRKFDINGDGVLNEQEFMELYKWTLWLKYEDLDPPIKKRCEVIKQVHRGNPNSFYYIGAKIGQGQFGIVNMVRHRETGAERVLKTINKRTAVQSGTPLNMLSQEMDILALLDHPHILRLFEHYNDTENIYIVTDVCYGGHLLQIVEEHCSQRKPMPEAWVSRFFMARALCTRTSSSRI